MTLNGRSNGMYVDFLNDLDNGEEVK
ncbi:uncharacterized protein G2W53_004304 [Senna tora]|uniref:Uncharacterized protein n=1 Tax=Senna tora TaxID=362788 RepID=A0A835CGE4_9FABA|nr:uncharacterized protein G2W53_004304 [Senna tora]